MKLTGPRRVVAGAVMTGFLGLIGYVGHGRVHIGGMHSNKLPASSGPAAQNSPDDTPIHINSATAHDFERLPGIGPSLSQRIVDYRNTNGPFQSVDDLRNVKGIGPKLFGKISSWLAL
ncbi:MAG: helix-hairpin-helix domain-containing protein [Armatimonadetes bacterium]|nr:helix-hairpin-helix domain-containing protein [Armatimonadota bacterium]